MEIFKTIIKLLFGTFLWYGIFSLCIWDYNIAHWSWVARAVCLFFTVIAIGKSLEL